MSHIGRAGPPDITDTYSLLVLNISFRTTVDDLFPLFDKYGKVVDIHIPRDRRTGESRGFAFVRYKYGDEAQKAVDRLDGSKLSSIVLRGDRWMVEKSRSSLRNMVQMLRESTREGSWSLLPRLEAQGRVGRETTTEEVGVEAWTGMIVTGTGNEREALAVAAGAAVTVLATTEVVAEIVMMMRGADRLKAPLLQGEVGVLEEVLHPVRESLLSDHLCLGVSLQTGAVVKDILCLLVVLYLPVEAHHMGRWTTRVAPLLASQMRSNC